jgi:hypothetical protein
MKKIIFMAVFIFLNARPAYADDGYYSPNFIRISCIPEAQYLDVEYQAVEMMKYDATSKSKGIWEKHGFYDPRNLTYKCKLAGVEYKIVTSLGPEGEMQCGGAPEIFFSLFRNGKPMLDDVVFGYSCFRHQSVKNITIQDGRPGWYDRRLEICPLSGDDKCKYFFDRDGSGKFPVDPINEKGLEGLFGEPKDDPP